MLRIAMTAKVRRKLVLSFFSSMPSPIIDALNYSMLG
jgi:hypothetical protein